MEEKRTPSKFNHWIRGSFMGAAFKKIDNDPQFEVSIVPDSSRNCATNCFVLALARYCRSCHFCD